MPTARIFTPENRLSKVLDGPGATEKRLLIAAAEERVAERASAIAAFVRAEVQRILAYSAQSDATLFAECWTLEGLALKVAEVAGAAGMEAIGDVTRGIAATVNNLRGTGALHTEALRVHIQSLALVSQGSGGRTRENEVVVDRLATMRRMIGIAE
jgi:hypothetical protein